MGWIQVSEDEQPIARASGLVFLINQLAGSNNTSALPNQTLKTEANVYAWLTKAKEILLKKVQKEPVIV